MDITANDIRKFQALVRSHYELDISEDAARQRLSLLIRQVELAYQPITADQLKKLKNENADHDYSQKA